MAVLEFEPREGDIDWNLTAVGIILFIIRTWSMTWMFQGDGTLIGDASHISYFIALLTALALVTSFRYTLLNAIPVGVLPSVLITIPFKDMPKLLDPEIFLTKEWWSALTIHIPVAIIGVYLLLAAEWKINKKTILIAVTTFISYFLLYDNKDNGVLNGIEYTIVVLVIIPIWTWILFRFFLQNERTTDTLVAPLIRRVR